MWKRIKRRIRRIISPTIADRWRKDRGDETLRLNYPLNSNSLVLDIGGYHGDWAAQIHAKYHCRLDIFEAVPDFATAIANRFKDIENIRIYPFALGSDDRTEEMVLSNDGSSVFLKNGPRTTVTFKDAAVWHKSQGAPSISLVKINIEGGEYELLEHWIKNGIIPSIDHLQIQFHRIAPNSEDRRNIIREKLQESHKLMWNYEFVWEGWSRKI
jgi:FkbM family methyltransferase